MPVGTTLVILLGLIALFLYGLGNSLIPLTFSAFLAYLLFPLIHRLEGKRINRNITVLLALLTLAAISIFLVIFIAPPLFRELRELIQELPNRIDSALAWIQITAERNGYSLPIDREHLLAGLKDQIEHLSLGSIQSFTPVLKNISSNLLGFFLAWMNLLLIPVFFIYIINDYEKILRSIRSLVPPKWTPAFLRVQNEANAILKSYVRGQFLVAMTLACIYSTGLMIVGLRFGLVIGIATGLLSIIPYVGFSLGLVTAIIVCLSQFSYELLAGVLAVFALGQVLESFLITPKLVGNKVGLRPLAALIALIVGANLAGFFGMLIAIPAAGILRVISKEILACYRQNWVTN